MEKDIPIEKSTIPHAAIDQVITWLEVGYETTVTRKSDGSRITIRIETEAKAIEKAETLKMLREFHSENIEVSHDWGTKELKQLTG